MDINIQIRPILNFPDYFAGSDGYIYSRKSRSKIKKETFKKLKCGMTGANYYMVVLCKDNKHYSKDVHKLICESFHGPRTSKNFTVSHINSNNLDNRVENLCWETYQDNFKRTLNHGTDDCGVRNSRALIKDETIVIKIKELLQSKQYTHKQIGEMFGLTRLLITKINLGISYKR
ncbi:MAG: HNH endonuclease signature motif containing protein [Nanoarchaeota archaeon]